MGSWGTSIFADDLALDIRREYSILLSVGKSDEEAEKMLIDYYSSILNCNDPDEDVFWFVLALCEWKKGRLSLNVKKKAMGALENGRDLNRWNTPGNEKNYAKRKMVLNKLKEVLLSPQPPLKKIKKPTVHHCPWKVGSLLAYRIVSNKNYLCGRPCYTKYVLLRIVRIDKRPISKLFDTGYYDETMLVGLYNWIGNEIPDPKIVHSLEYIVIDEDDFIRPNINQFDESLLNSLSGESRKKVTESVASIFKRIPEKCVWLNWCLSRGEPKDVFTFLDGDDFSNDIPEFFKPTPKSRTYANNTSFDIMLSRRFDPYLINQPNHESLLI